MSQTRYKIAIVGLGMVGGALSKWFPDAIQYDPPKGIGSDEELNQADIIFICVPTPHLDGKQDISIIKDVIRKLKKDKLVVIKSTVLPGTTKYLQEYFPRHRFLFNPEFLTEETADQDMKYPDRQIVGHTKKSFSVAGEIMAMLPMAPYEKIMPSGEAEMVKYMGNTWFATKVVWANQMYDLCEELSLDYEIAKEALAQDKRIGRSHLEIFHKGYRGYGGKCLPKDTRSLIKLADDSGVEMSLLKKVEEINNTYAKTEKD